MATAFPVGLPRPMRARYGYAVQPLSVTQQSDRGLARRRRIGTGKSVQMTLNWTFTEAELVTFANWWRDDIFYGTDDFDIQLLNGYDDISQNVRPAGPYTAENLIGAWSVSLPVELVELPMATQAVMQDAIDNYNDLLFADDFHYLVHVTIPENL